MKVLSSHLTFIYKYLFTSLMILIYLFVFCLLFTYRDDAVFSAVLIIGILLIIGTGFVFYQCISIKKVKFDNSYLYISNYIKKVNVPFSNVKSISKWFICFYIIDFRNKTEFGNSIVLLPHLFDIIEGLFSTPTNLKTIRKLIK